MSYSLDETFNARMDGAKQSERDRSNRGNGRSTWKPFKRDANEAQHRKRFDDGERKQNQLDALRRAEDGSTVTNYPAIYSGFMAKGIAECDILPRENVFTLTPLGLVGGKSKPLAQRFAEAPLKPEAPQEPCDVGLFSDDARQMDLMDRCKS